jgi:hypothetical protein
MSLRLVVVSLRRYARMLARPWAENMEVRHLQTEAEVVRPIIWASTSSVIDPSNTPMTR